MVEDINQLNVNISMPSFIVLNNIFPEINLLSLSCDSEAMLSLVALSPSILIPVLLLGVSFLFCHCVTSAFILFIVHRNILFPVKIFLLYRYFTQVFHSKYFFQIMTNKKSFHFNRKMKF